MVKATEVTTGLAESNGSLLPGLWRDSLHVTCWLTACTPGSAPGPTLGNEYGKTLPLNFFRPYITLRIGVRVRSVPRAVRRRQVRRSAGARRTGRRADKVPAPNTDHPPGSPAARSSSIAPPLTKSQSPHYWRRGRYSGY